jgi:hypothetical protein
MSLYGILRPRWIVLATAFCASLFLTACGSMVGGNSLGPGIAPQFTSTPRTTAFDGAANFETNPNRSALPTASVSVISAPMLISN